VSALPSAAAARALGVTRQTLARWTASGCPVLRAGQRGRGCSAVYDVDAVLAWRNNESSAALVLEFASAVPQVLAAAVDEAFRTADGSVDKRRLIAPLLSVWLNGTAELLTLLRAHSPTVGTLGGPIPPAIERLRAVAKTRTG
jgi:hypothetical protein